MAAVAIATNQQYFNESGAWCEPGPALFFSRPCPADGLRDGNAHFPQTVPNKDMNETKEQHIEVEGVVASVLAGTMFRVELQNKHVVLATICGKMRKRWVRITTGDRVKMEMSPYDLNKARITWRLR